MSTYTALLHDGTIIPIADGTYTLNLVCNFDTKEAFEEAWGYMTKEALRSLEIRRDGVTVGTFYNCVLLSIQIVANADTTYTVHFYLREGDYSGDRPKSYTEQLEERIAQLESGQDVQDGAIEDLGMAISEIAEGQEA